MFLTIYTLSERDKIFIRFIIPVDTGRKLNAQNNKLLNYKLLDQNHIPINKINWKKIEKTKLFNIISVIDVDLKQEQVQGQVPWKFPKFITLVEERGWVKPQIPLTNC